MYIHNVCTYMYIYIYILKLAPAARFRGQLESTVTVPEKAIEQLQGNHLSNTACLTRAVFNKMGEHCSKVW